jgi:hypothetical protein
LIVTNNPKIQENYNSRFTVVFVRGNYREVLVQARDLIHKGHKLLTHPLMGSLKPNETPYRSVVLSDDSSGVTDSDSVMMIEDSIMVFDKFAKTARHDRGESSTEKIKEDFMEIDLSLLKSALD